MLKIDIWNILFILIDLVVLYLFMCRFLLGPVSRILEERRNMVEHELDEAAKSRADAQKMKEQYEASISEAKSEAAQIVAAARDRAAGESQRILKEGREEAARKLREADQQIQLEREKAMDDLKTGVAGLAMSAAAKLLSQQTGEERDRQIYSRFLAGSGEKHD